MRTNVLERLEKKTKQTLQGQARLVEEMARLKTEVKRARTGMIRAAGMFDLDPHDLQQELLFVKSLRDLVAANKLNQEELYRELLDVANRKASKLAAKFPTVVDAAE